MDPLKDVVGRHGTGVEMTMSLSGPPGFSHHTTVTSDSLHHYMSRQGKLIPTDDPRAPRAVPIDPRGHKAMGLSSHDLRMTGHDPQLQPRDVKSMEGNRVGHNPRGMEPMPSKDAQRMMPELHHHQMAQQHAIQRADSRNYPVMGQEKRGMIPDARTSRETLLLAEARASQMPLPSPGRSSRPHQQSLNDPLRAVYDGIEAGMATYAAQLPPGAAGHPPHGNQTKSIGSQNMPGPPMVHTYPPQKPRPSENLLPSGPNIHPTQDHSNYLPGKQSRVYQGEYSKIPPEHYISEMGKPSSVHDIKQGMVLHQSEPISPQHRDMMRDLGSDIRDPRYSSSLSRSVQKHGMEMSSQHMKQIAIDASLSDGRRHEEHLRKSASFTGGSSAVPQQLYNKTQSHESLAGLTKVMSYPLSADMTPRSGQAPSSMVTHAQQPPVLHTSAYPPQPQSIPERGGAFGHEHHTPGQMQKNTVIRQNIPGEEVAWREGGYAQSAPKQPRPAYHTEDITTPKPLPSLVSDHEPNHLSLRDVGPPRLQGSISTGQPRIMYDTAIKPSSYQDQRAQATSDRYQVSPREYGTSRPSSIGRTPQIQTSVSVIPHDDRQVHGQTEKTAGQSALDLTKLPQGTSKPGDSPLDLTVKTKKRHNEDEIQEFTAKRQKTETSSPRSVGPQKVNVNALDNIHNPIWISSPSPRGPESYEHRPLPSPSYTLHASSSAMNRHIKYTYGPDSHADHRGVADGRLSAETRISGDGRTSVESRSSADGRPISSPHLHGKFNMGGSQVKMVSSSIVPEMVKHAGGNNPQMVPLTTQLQKVREEQAYQMKLQQRMGTETPSNTHVDSKRMYKDTISPRSLENTNEVVVVRHPQQNYDIPPSSRDIPSQSQQQQAFTHSYMKQQQQHLQQRMESHPLHQHHQKLSDQQESIELGLKDSSDPLQASRASTMGQLRSFSGQAALLQHHQQQMYLQQRQKDQQSQLSPFSHPQQSQYTKDQLHQQHSQQAFSKQQAQLYSQQHYHGAEYSSKHEEMDRMYQKQQQQQQRKRTEAESYKQPAGAAHNTLASSQKWNAQQRLSIRPGFPQTQPFQAAPGDYQPPKLVPGYAKNSQNMIMARENDVMKYPYARSERGAKSNDFMKSSLPQTASHLPAGGVREESRRALSRRGSCPGASNQQNPEYTKLAETARKESSSSMPDRTSKVDDSRGSSHKKVDSSNAKSERVNNGNAVDKNIDVKLDDNSSDVIILSPQLPAPPKSAEETSAKDSVINQASAKFALPLSVTIPQSISPMTAPLSPSALSSSSSKTSIPHKAWSKKHMILNAFNQDESLKRIISSTSSKHEAGGISSECKRKIIASSTCSPIPTSPKMPILSPQEDEGEVTNEDQGVRTQQNNDDPPTLAPIKKGQGKPSLNRTLSQTSSSSSSLPTNNGTPAADAPVLKEAYKNNNNSHDVANNNSNFCNSSGAGSLAKDVPNSKEEMSGNAIVVRRCSLGAALSPEQQQQSLQPMLEDPSKASTGNLSFQRSTSEVIRRNSLACNWGHTKNIPIANVAPFVHSRVEDEKKQQKVEEQIIALHQGATGSAQSITGQPLDLQLDPKEGGPLIKPEDLDIKAGTDSQIKSASDILASSSKKDFTAKKKKVAKLRVSSPTKMKEFELLSASIDYTVLKSSSGIDDIKALGKLNHSSVKKSLENRIKYKHKIVREKNTIVKPKKVVKKRIQYVFDDDENEEENHLFIEDDDDEDYEYNGGSKTNKETAKADAEAKVRDREERALRREQLRDQSEESNARQPVSSGNSQSSSKNRDKNSSETLNKTRSKGSSKGKRNSATAKGNSRISRRRLSSTNQRAQELKHNALVQRRNTGKRKIRRYNRNAAYEQELHREANRRAVVRAKRQASSKARERLSQQRDNSLDQDNDDSVLGESWVPPETKTSTGSAKKNHQNATGKTGGNKGTGRLVSGKGNSCSKISGASTSGAHHKEDYESDVENVPEDLVAEMVSDDATPSSKRKKVRGKMKAKAGGEDEEGQDGLEDEGEFENEQCDVISSIPVENVPVPADVKKLTVNKNSGETLLHRAARMGHEEITLYCLKTKTVHVNARDNAGYTPLHESCVRGSVAVARHLIYYGADVNCCSQDGIRPIHDAIENDHLEVVRLLLVHGADPLIATYAGRTPVRIAKSLPMLQTLQGYIGDLNGWVEEEEEEDSDQVQLEEIPWRFTTTITLKNIQTESYSPFVDLPADPADDSTDVFDDGPTSAINVFNLALDGEDRTPQPFCLLDEVLFRLCMAKENLTALFQWKPTSITLSCERVREVASCCCSNVSIRLPQSGKVTLLPLSSLREIETALKIQMVMKVKKEEGSPPAECSKNDSLMSRIPILTRLEQPSFLEEGRDIYQKEKSGSKNVTPSAPIKQKTKLGASSSLPMYPSTALFTSSSPLLNQNSGTPKTQKSQSLTLSQPWSSAVLEAHSNKKSQHQYPSHPHASQPAGKSQPHSASSRGDNVLPFKGNMASRENRTQSSGSSVSRKSKKEDSESAWLNAPMFSDDSSSSPFHTSIDCFDSDNSM
ncbi:uncharacterized protein LOC131957416 [Physella acuta]|uniref:uncharacterized protein LOC131957416 n=1 Tax=Physella acuta TaxID=109671 RepID=UPI0027DD56AA|nr:uncharacterized protein LOC131957416 [Physella acuta]